MRVGHTADHRLSVRGRACADAQGRCDGDWLRRNRLIPPPAPHHRCGRLVSSPFKNTGISLVKSPERRPWAKTAKTARPLLPGAPNPFSCLEYRSCLYGQVSYPPSVKRSVNPRSVQADTEPKLGCSSRDCVGCKEKDPLHQPVTRPLLAAAVGCAPPVALFALRSTALR